MRKKIFLNNKIRFTLTLGVILLIFFLITIYPFRSEIRDRKKNPVGISDRPTSKAMTQIPTLTLKPKISEKKIYPSQVIDLTNWKITLPVGFSESPKEIKQPILATYALAPWFSLAPGGGVRFRAPVNAVTTGGSNYPRSELLEVTNNGRSKIGWSSQEGMHSMILDQAITAVPKIKQHIVAGQIHDQERDIIVIRLDNPNLHIRIGGKNVHTLDSQYALGKRFTVRFEVNDGKTRIYYNGETNPSYTLNLNYSNAYFKAGAYTQSNCSKEGPALCSDDNYGEVIVYQVTVAHR